MLARRTDLGEKAASSSDAVLLLDNLILGLHNERSDLADCGGLEDRTANG